MLIHLLCLACSMFCGGTAADETAAPPAATGSAEDFPLAEKLLPSVFAKQALAWLQAHPTSRFGPRVALDLLVSANAAGDDMLAGKARAELLLEHPSSTQAAFLLSSYKQPNELADFLVSLFDANLDPCPAGFSPKFLRAVDRGCEHFHQQIFSHRGLALRVALLTRRHPRHRFREPARAVLVAGSIGGRQATINAATAGMWQSEEEAIRAVSAVVVDDKPAARGGAIVDSVTVETIERLHALGDNRTARIAERFLLGELPEATRALPALRKIEATNCIARDKLDEAAAVLDQDWAGPADAEWLWCRALCHARQGQRDLALTALESLEVLERERADSVLGEAGRALSRSLRANQHETQILARHLLTTIKEMEGGDWRLFEAEVGINNPRTHRPVNVYFALDLAADLLEVHLGDERRPVFAYRCDAGGTRVFVSGEPAISHFRQRMSPQPTVSLRNGPNGFKLLWNLNFGDTLRTVPQANKAFFDTVAHAGATGIAQAMGHVHRMGWFLESVAEKEGELSIRAMRLGIDPLQIERCELQISPAERTLAFRSRLVESTRLRHGPAAAFELTPPAWPDLPVVEKESADISIIAHALSAMGELFSSSAPVAAKPAAKPVVR